MSEQNAAGISQVPAAPVTGAKEVEKKTKKEVETETHDSELMSDVDYNKIKAIKTAVKVVATQEGFYGNYRRMTGEKFVIENGKAFSRLWMKLDTEK